MKRLIPYLLFFSILFCGLNAYSLGNLTVKVSPDSLKNTYLIGDRIPLTITISTEKGSKINTPPFPSNSKIKILDSIKSDTLKSDANQLIIKQRMSVSAYDSGAFYFPSLEYTAIDGSNKTSNYITDSFALAFRTIDVDTTVAIKPIKGPIQVGWSILDYLNQILIGLGLAALIAFLIYYIRKRIKNKPKEIIPEIIDTRTPKQKASDRLMEIDSMLLWQNGKFKQYYTDVTDCLREYIHAQYGVDTLEMTTGQMLKALRTKLTKNQLNALQPILESADLVKFAKYTPIDVECTGLMDDAKTWLSKEGAD